MLAHVHAAERKKPMDRRLEKRLSERAVAIGREGNSAAFPKLLDLLWSPSVNVRRLSASAIGKLAWVGVDQAAAVAALAPVARTEVHPQTRQYAIKVLKAYGATAHACLPDLRDMARNLQDKDYIRRDAAAAVTFIEESIRIAAYGRTFTSPSWTCISNTGDWTRRSTR